VTASNSGQLDRTLPIMGFGKNCCHPHAKSVKAELIARTRSQHDGSRRGFGHWARYSGGS